MTIVGIWKGLLIVHSTVCLLTQVEGELRFLGL